jgi:ABC-type Mn2+/Zn2+ transport system ATPase subunit
MVEQTPLNPDDPLGPIHADPHELVVQDIHVHYGEVCAIHNLSFHAHCGSMLALVGPNGAGKSTLIKCIAGLLPTSSGTIQWRGRPLLQQHEEIAYLPQRSQVDWTFPMTVRGLVETGRLPLLGWFRGFRKVDETAVEQALEWMDICDLQTRQISALSGGQQQRAFIARALAQEPHVLLLDEPYSGLDQRSQDQLSHLLIRLKNSGRLILAAHHDLNSVSAYYDEVLVLNRTKEGLGPPGEVLTPDLLARIFQPEGLS